MSEDSFVCNPIGKQNDDLFTCLNRNRLVLCVPYDMFVLLTVSSIGRANEKGFFIELFQLGQDVGKRHHILSENRKACFKIFVTQV